MVLFQEWWGLDHSIERVCDRFAAEGFLAHEPELGGGGAERDAE